jgi:hypothetical protein
MLQISFTARTSFANGWMPSLTLFPASLSRADAQPPVSLMSLSQLGLTPQMVMETQVPPVYENFLFLSLFVCNSHHFSFRQAQHQNNSFYSLFFLPYMYFAVNMDVFSSLKPVLVSTCLAEPATSLDICTGFLVI